LLEVGIGVEGYKVGDKVSIITVFPVAAALTVGRGLQNLCPEQKYIGYDYPGALPNF
jgi:L-iditol 2-dehydrogenase